METKMNLKKVGITLAAVAASAFVASNLSGCATDMAAQNSTAATTQMQNSCKGMSCKGMAAEPEMHHRHHHHHHRDMHHKHPHHHHHKGAEKHEGKAAAAKESSPSKPKGSKCAGVAGQ